MKIRIPTVAKLLGCGVAVFLVADAQARLLFKTKFSALEGYTNGWMIGQPSTGAPAAAIAVALGLANALMRQIYRRIHSK